MAKKLPLTRRLQIALGETSSNSEREVVFGLLHRYVASKIPRSLSADEFYGQINHTTFSVEDNRKEISEQDRVQGRKLADYLTESVNLPEQNSPGYRKKMLQSMKFEYGLLREYVGKNE